MHRLSMLALGAAVAVCTATVGFGSSATAESGHAVLALGADLADQTSAESPFYAGYVGRGVGNAMTSADFHVPSFACGATDTGFVTTVYAISAKGKFLAGADLYSYCSGGKFVLDGHVTTSGGQVPIWQDLQPGDDVRLSITAHAQGTSTHDVAFQSLTRDWTSTLPTKSSVSRIEIVQRRMSLDGVSLDVPAYGVFRFTNVVFDDVPLTDANASRVSLVDDDGAVLVNTRKPHGEAFALVSKAS